MENNIVTMFESLSLRDQIAWILEHKDIVRLELDNDDTTVVFSEEHGADEWGDPLSASLEDYFGWNDAIVELLDLLGVQAEPV